MNDPASAEISPRMCGHFKKKHLEGMLKEIDRAIVRAGKGTYGICEHCKKPIPEERLKVMPSATMCIDCAKLQTRPTKVLTVS